MEFFGRFFMVLDILQFSFMTCHWVLDPKQMVRSIGKQWMLNPCTYSKSQWHCTEHELYSWYLWEELNSMEKTFCSQLCSMARGKQFEVLNSYRLKASIFHWLQWFLCNLVQVLSHTKLLKMQSDVYMFARYFERDWNNNYPIGTDVMDDKFVGSAQSMRSRQKSIWDFLTCFFLSFSNPLLAFLSQHFKFLVESEYARSFKR